MTRPAGRFGVLAMALAAVLLGAVQLSPTSAGATTVAASASAGLCPAPGQTDRFVDLRGTTHEAKISCAAAYGLVSGTSATTFNPAGQLTRAQAATILVNYVEKASGASLSVDGLTPFGDVAGGPHGTAIAKAAANGLVNGYADGTFRGGEHISRAQFATVAVRATERVLGAELATDDHDAFDDDNRSTHERNIEKAVDNGILSGVGPRRFAPDDAVTRAQAGAIVMNAATNVLDPAGRFLAKHRFSAAVEWSNDRSWAEITTSHDLSWSRAWACGDGVVEAVEWVHHDGGTRSARYEGDALLVVDFAYADGPPVQADGTQLAWYSNLVAPGNTGENGPYAIGQAC